MIASKSSSKLTNIVSDTISIDFVNQDITLKASYSITSINIIASGISTNSLPVSKISIEQNNILQRDTSTQIHKPIKYYSLHAIDDTISLSGIINYAFIIVSNESSVVLELRKVNSSYFVFLSYFYFYLFSYFGFRVRV